MLASFPDRRARCDFAIAELRKDVVHLQEDRLQKSDEEKEDDDARESRIGRSAA